MLRPGASAGEAGVVDVRTAGTLPHLPAGPRQPVESAAGGHHRADVPPDQRDGPLAEHRSQRQRCPAELAQPNPTPRGDHLPSFEFDGGSEFHLWERYPPQQFAVPAADDRRDVRAAAADRDLEP